MRLKYNMDTKLTYQIGDNLQHSAVGALHNGMFEMIHVDAINLLCEVKKGELGPFVEACKTLGVFAFNLTMPHKSDIIEFLDECEESSRAFKCVNNVNITKDGRLIGVGLDGVGMGLAIDEILGNQYISGKKVLIIGGGAVAGLIAADLCKRGAKSFVIVNRTVEKAQYIADTLKDLYGVEAVAGPLDDAYMTEVAPSIDLSVQCTSLGMIGKDHDFASLNFIDALPATAAVTDVLYPTTKYLEAAKKRGLPTVTGAKMLMYQQAASLRFRFGDDISLPEDWIELAEEYLETGITIRGIRDKRRLEKGEK